MKDLKNAIFHLEKANARLSDADTAYIKGRWNIANAEFDLAMCSEHGLKAYLYYSGVEPSGTHSHKLLILEAGKAKIPIPKYIRSYADVLYDFEKCTRYDADYDVDATEYEEVRDACNKFLLVLNSTIKVEAISRLRELLPPSKSDISDDDLLFKYWREL